LVDLSSYPPPVERGRTALAKRMDEEDDILLGVGTPVSDLSVERKNE